MAAKDIKKILVEAVESYIENYQNPIWSEVEKKFLLDFVKEMAPEISDELSNFYSVL